jgi:hypothetical protein
VRKKIVVPGLVAGAKGTVISDENDYSPFSGRFNPGFTEQVNTFMINP